MYRIREDFGKKTAEEIREGSVVKRAEDDSLYKFIGVAKNTSSCEYEAVLMALSGDYGLYTVPVKDLSKREAFRGFFFMHEKRSLNWLLKKLPLLSHSMRPERPDLHTGYFEIKDI